MDKIIEFGRPIPFTNAANLTLKAGTRILGIWCSSSTSGTIAIGDGTVTHVGTTTLAAATWYRLPILIRKDSTLTVGGTLVATLVVVDG